MKPFGAEARISLQLHNVTVAREEAQRAAAEYNTLTEKYSSHIHASKTKKEARYQVRHNQAEENKSKDKKILQLIGLEVTSEHKTNIASFHDLLKTVPIGEGALLGFDVIDSLGGHAMVVFRQHADTNGVNTNSGKDKVRVFDPNFGEFLVPLEEVKRFLEVLIKIYKDEDDYQFELEELLTIKKSTDGKGDILAVQEKKQRQPLSEAQLKDLYANKDPD